MDTGKMHVCVHCVTYAMHWKMNCTAIVCDRLNTASVNKLITSTLYNEMASHFDSFQLCGTLRTAHATDAQYRTSTTLEPSNKPIQTL